MELYKTDIHSLGHTAYDDGGYLSIICDHKTANIEALLLREILKMFNTGEDKYEIIHTNDFFWNSAYNIPDVEIVTNLPLEEYEKIRIY